MGSFISFLKLGYMPPHALRIDPMYNFSTITHTTAQTEHSYSHGVVIDCWTPRRRGCMLLGWSLGLSWDHIGRLNLLIKAVSSLIVWCPMQPQEPTVSTSKKALSRGSPLPLDSCTFKSSSRMSHTKWETGESRGIKCEQIRWHLLFQCSNHMWTVNASNYHWHKTYFCQTLQQWSLASVL